MSGMTACRTALAAMSFGAVSLLAAPTIHAQLHSSPKTVTGKVSAVEGRFQMTKDYRGQDSLKMIDTSYTVTTSSGQQIELKLTRETKVPTRANPGDRIEAMVTEKGQTLSVKLMEDSSEPR